MKVPRPSHLAKSAATAGKSAVTGGRGKEFASRLEQAESASKATPGSAKATRARGAGTVADIGANLESGKISPRAAIDQVVERILDQQLAGRGDLALRAKVGAALRESLADDPLLAAKVRALGQD